MEESTNTATFAGTVESLSADPKPFGSRSNLKAALLSTVVPGSGQLYLGDRRRSTVLLLLLAATLIGFWPLRLLRSYLGFCLLYCAWIGIFLYAPLSALVARGERVTKPSSKWWIALFLPLSLIVTQLLGMAVARAAGFRSFQVPSTSMERTIQKGDRIVADFRYYDARTPERDDVIVFKSKDTFFVKRVIAVGGDTISGKDGFIFLNGQALVEPFVEHGDSHTTSLSDAFGPITVPRDRFFVMGDNRDVSLDSRYPSFGLVDKSSIVGKTLYIFASSRQGKKIQ